MSLRAIDEILDATEHLPDGATLVVPQVAWDDYERLLEGLTERRHLRVSYDCGRLEIMSPSSAHEDYARFFDQIVVVFADAFGLKAESRGSTTWKKRAVDKGVEPDSCYYVQNAHRIIGKQRIELEADPPPDIAVEIDVTGGSLRKLPIYAALAIPEVWRYDGQTAEIHQLTDAGYIEIPASRFLPGLTGAIMVEFIGLSKIQGQTEARHALQRRIHSLK